MTQRIALITCCGANFNSVRFALARLGVQTEDTTDPAAVAAADKIILPGVGAAAVAMQALERHGLVDVLRNNKKPLLGVCVGMQVLYERSEEGDVACLGLLPGTVARFPETGADGARLRVPHMGWNSLNIKRAGALLDGIADGAYAYFVHSFRAPVSAFTIAESDYGGPFAAAVQKDNLYACQFHPERSAGVGARLLRNFTEMPC
ncbi:MAG: imidazole glycerol phosphate synthase subunit HisH [Alphaproteobacteria bacterium]|nr:imidazole glycerol phosphate synthase subunit HisH [Alphaproteobacteria bacterium]